MFARTYQSLPYDTARSGAFQNSDVQFTADCTPTRFLHALLFPSSHKSRQRRGFLDRCKTHCHLTRDAPPLHCLQIHSSNVHFAATLTSTRFYLLLLPPFIASRRRWKCLGRRKTRRHLTCYALPLHGCIAMTRVVTTANFTPLRLRMPCCVPLTNPGGAYDFWVEAKRAAT